jgi:hypothetical protein
MREIIKTFKGSWNAVHNETTTRDTKTSGNPLPHPNKENLGDTYRISQSGFYAGGNWKAGYDIMSTGTEWTCLLVFKDEDGNDCRFVDAHDRMPEPFIDFSKIPNVDVEAVKHIIQDSEVEVNGSGTSTTVYLGADRADESLDETSKPSDELLEVVKQKTKIVKIYKGSWSPITNRVETYDIYHGTTLPDASEKNLGHTYKVSQTGTTLKNGKYQSWLVGYQIISTGVEWVGESEHEDRDGNIFVFVDETESMLDKKSLGDAIKGSNMRDALKSVGFMFTPSTTSKVSHTIAIDKDGEKTNMFSDDVAEHMVQDFEKKGLISFEDHQTSALARYEERMIKDIHPNGIACPKCGSELYDTEPDIILTTLPAQLNVKCTNHKCDFDGYRFK